MTPKLINDIDLAQWREYPDILTESLWIIQSRAKGAGHDLNYHGNFVPQIPHQLIRRYTRAGEIVLDPFLGGGTTAIEARNLGRRCIGIDLNPEMIERVRSGFTEQELYGIRLFDGDSCDPYTYNLVGNELDMMAAKKAQLVILHPPYHDIIKFSDKAADLSNQDSVEMFLIGLEQTIAQCAALLENGRYLAIVIGDIVVRGNYIPLGFRVMQSALSLGLELRQIVVKNMAGNEAKGQKGNLWRYRSLKNGTYVFKHEYILILRRLPKSARN